MHKDSCYTGIFFYFDPSYSILKKPPTAYEKNMACHFDADRYVSKFTTGKHHTAASLHAGKTGCVYRKCFNTDHQ